MNLHLSEQYPNQVDLCQIIAQAGLGHVYNIRSLYTWNNPYSDLLYKQIVKALSLHTFVSQKRIKCLVLDCDGVLWPGTLCEDKSIGLGPIGMGRFYLDFQRRLLQYHEEGVLLTLCTKNDLKDIETVFESNTEMILKRSHFSFIASNWENKWKSIKKISSFLKINTEHMLFIDDSGCEIEELHQYLPEIKAIHFNPETVYSELDSVCFSKTDDINISNFRQSTYQTDKLRETLKSEYQSEAAYLDALQTKVEIRSSVASDLPRIADLSQRTNRCSNGKRLCLDELEDLISSGGYRLYSVIVSDRYSNLGLVGAMGVQTHGGRCILNLFCLSCRALGREVEQKMLRYLETEGLKVNAYVFETTRYNPKLADVLNEFLPLCEILKPVSGS